MIDTGLLVVGTVIEYNGEYVVVRWDGWENNGRYTEEELEHLTTLTKE